MKTASFPSLQVEPELRKAVEEVLEEGESLAHFLEQAIRDGVAQRRHKAAPVDSANETRGRHSSASDHRFADDMLKSLEAMLAEAKKVAMS